MSDFAYALGHKFNWAALHALSHVVMQGGEDLPTAGPVLVMTNHLSHFDPLLLGISLPRPVDYMADKPLLEIPVVGRILKSWNAFPIDRTKSDRATVKTALERFKANRVVGVFPEGGVRHGEASMLRDQPLPKGTVNLWRMAKCPALVGAIVGTDQLYQWRSIYRPTRIFIRWRPLLPAPKREDDTEALRETLEREIRQAARELDKQFQFRPEEESRSAQQRWKEK